METKDFFIKSVSVNMIQEDVWEKINQYCPRYSISQVKIQATITDSKSWFLGQFVFMLMHDQSKMVTIVYNYTTICGFVLKLFWFQDKPHSQLTMWCNQQLDLK